MGVKFGVNFLENPELLQQPKFAIYAAADFWRLKGLNRFEQMGEQWATRTVNGGLSGHAERMAIYRRALVVAG